MSSCGFLKITGVKTPTPGQMESLYRTIVFKILKHFGSVKYYVIKQFRVKESKNECKEIQTLDFPVYRSICQTAFCFQFDKYKKVPFQRNVN